MKKYVVEKKMNKAELQKKIDNFASCEEWNHNYLFPFGVQTKPNTSDSPGNNVKKWDRLKPILKDLDVLNKSILDIGCSDGFYSVKCAELGARKVLGVDLDDLRLERARFSAQVLEVENVEFENSDIYGDTFGNRKSDIVLALGIIHRVPDIYGFLTRIAELGEVMILEFKTSSSKASICEWGGGETKVNKFNHLFFLPSIKFITDILQHLNFEVTVTDVDTSKLKYKRTIIVAQKTKKNMNEVFSNYKNKHEGERVFLVGNGPSLAETDLNLLIDENTIAMNRISLIYPKVGKWRPTYYLFSSTNVMDKTWGDEWLSSVHSAISEPKTSSFIASEFKPYIDPNDNFLDVNWFSSMSETRPNKNGEISPNSFSKDIVERIDKSGTTMNLALQLAYHMGFSEIIIVGADLGWTKDSGTTDDPNHFDKSYRANISNPYKANQQMRNVHKLASSIFKKDKPSVKIYNASAKTVLDTYPIIDFEEYIRNNNIVRCPEVENQAKNFWERQVYIAPPKRSFIFQQLRKIKTKILGRVGGQ